MAALTLRVPKGSPLTLEESDANLTAINTELEDATGKTTVVPYYHFHGFAGDQTAGDNKFFDKAGSNHGVRGVDLSDTTMFANAGFVTTANPSGGLNDTAIRIPTLNLDYLGGEKLIVWWLGKATPEASDFPLLGDGVSTAGSHGIQVRVKTTGKMDIVAIGATANYSGATTNTVFDGTLHSAAFALDGSDHTHCLWVDDEVSYGGGVGFTALGAAAVDTLTSNTFNIGQTAAAPGSTEGGVIQTRALVIIRLPSSYAMPGATALTSMFQQLRTNPGKLVLIGAI